MSYSTINLCAHALALHGRVTAACAQEGADHPESSMASVIWPLSSQTDIEAAYASALEGDNPDPGGDESVITDGMILSVVQHILSPPPPVDG